jgi:hypothetical protein
MYPIGSFSADKKPDQDEFATSSSEDLHNRRLEERRVQATTDRAAHQSRRAQLAPIGCFHGADLRQRFEEQETLRHLLRTNPVLVYLLEANELHYFYEVMEGETTMPITQDVGHWLVLRDIIVVWWRARTRGTCRYRMNMTQELDINFVCV